MDSNNNAFDNGRYYKRLALVFIICGLMGSLIIDSDHLQPIINKPREFNFSMSVDDYWEASTGQVRILHTASFVMISTLLSFLLFYKKVVYYDY